MNNKVSNDDILLDRLVDDELSADERRALLESLDSRPQGWRRCALAFLEAQSWRSDLGAVVVGSNSMLAAANAVAPSQVPQRRTIWAAAEWFAVAAALVLAFKLGGWQRNSGVPIASILANPGNQQLANAPPAVGTAAPNAAKPGDAINLWVRDDGGQLKRVRVPLV